MRVTTDLAPIMIAAVLLLLVGVAALLVHARRSGRVDRLLKTGVVVALVGVGVLAVALFVQAAFFAGDFGAMPTLVIPGGIALAVGVFVVGIAVLRLMPRWVGASLVVGALAIVVANDQDVRVLLYIPFGLAWMVVGWALWITPRGQDAPGALAGSRR
jgi:uncharacterized membrane protein